jgi:hypothetical protein
LYQEYDLENEQPKRHQRTFRMPEKALGIGVKFGIGAVERLWLRLGSHRALKAWLYKNKDGVLNGKNNE